MRNIDAEIKAVDLMIIGARNACDPIGEYKLTVQRFELLEEKKKGVESKKINESRLESMNHGRILLKDRLDNGIVELYDGIPTGIRKPMKDADRFRAKRMLSMIDKQMNQIIGQSCIS